jgi:hypothetical protein
MMVGLIAFVLFTSEVVASSINIVVLLELKLMSLTYTIIFIYSHIRNEGQSSRDHIICQECGTELTKGNLVNNTTLFATSLVAFLIGTSLLAFF